MSQQQASLLESECVDNSDWLRDVCLCEPAASLSFEKANVIIMVTDFASNSDACLCKPTTSLSFEKEGTCRF